MYIYIYFQNCVVIPVEHVDGVAKESPAGRSSVWRSSLYLWKMLMALLRNLRLTGAVCEDVTHRHDFFSAVSVLVVPVGW